MSFALLFAGILLLVSGVRGTQGDLFALLKNDFTGPGTFFYWSLVVIVIGSIGYVPRLRPLSRVFLVLLIVVLFLAKGNPNAVGGGFFFQLTAGLGSTNAAQANTANATGNGSGLGSLWQSLTNYFGSKGA